MKLLHMSRIEEFPELYVMESDEENDISKKNLIEKGYLKEIEQSELLISQELVFYMNIVKRSEGGFAVLKRENVEVGSESKHFCFYFSGENILLIEKEGVSYQMMILPYLPLAVGFLSNTITEFSNSETEILYDGEFEKFDPNRISRMNDSKNMWIMSGWSKSEDVEDCVFIIVEDEKQRFLIELNKEKIKITKPKKVDLINTCTKWLSKIHANSIRKLNGGISDECI
jgi:hypothetical protein